MGELVAIERPDGTVVRIYDRAIALEALRGEKPAAPKPATSSAPKRRRKSKARRPVAGPTPTNIKEMSARLGVHKEDLSRRIILTRNTLRVLFGRRDNPSAVPPAVLARMVGSEKSQGWSRTFSASVLAFSGVLGVDPLTVYEKNSNGYLPGPNVKVLLDRLETFIE